MQKAFKKLSFPKIKNLLYYYLKGLHQRVDEHHIFLLGGGLAFSVFICITPLILVIFFIMGNILETASLEHQITAIINTMVPYSEYAAFIKRIISSRIQEVIAHKDLAAYVGLPALILAASGLFSSLRTILNEVFNVKEEESILSGKLKDIVLVVVVLTLIALLTTVLPILEIIKDAPSQWTFFRFLEFTAIQKLFFTIGSFVIIYSIFFVIYYFVPYKRIGFKTAALSALWASILWEIAKQLFGYYITHFATLGKIYGAYIFIVVVGFWIYYSSLTFILAAEIGQLYRERRTNVAGG